jgi:hypothetical protein
MGETARRHPQEEVMPNKIVGGGSWLGTVPNKTGMCKKTRT